MRNHASMCRCCGDVGMLRSLLQLLPELLLLLNGIRGARHSTGIQEAQQQQGGARRHAVFALASSLAIMRRDSVCRALTSARAGRPSEAEPLYQEALAGRRETLGWHHPHTLVTVGGYARLLCVRWRCGGRVDAALADEAAALLRERVEGLRARARGVVNSSSGTETAAATRSNTHEGGGDDKENGDGSTSSGQHGPHGGGGKDAAGGSAAAAAAERLLAEFLRESGRRALGD